MKPPFISVIVPVRDDRAGLKKLLLSLDRQRYPSESFEIIVIQNCATENYGPLVEPYKHASLLREDAKPNAYTARNAGLRHARGEILAFTDADCLPEPHWLEEGVKCLEWDKADLVAGSIQFNLPSNATAAQMLDSILFLQQERNVKQRQLASTANLFVKRSVLDAIGEFPDDCESGGDTIVSRRAVQAGFKLSYCPEALVTHDRARTALPLLHKAFRIGRGIAYRRALLGEKSEAHADHPMKELLKPRNLRARLQKKSLRVSPLQFWGMVGFVYLTALSGTLGYFHFWGEGKKE